MQRLCIDIQKGGDGGHSPLWETFSAENMKTRKNIKLQGKNKASKSSSSLWMNLAKTKSEWIKTKSELELKILKEQHEEFLKTKRLERELMMEKHKIEMQIFSLQMEKYK